MSEFPVWLHHPGFRPAVISMGMAGVRVPSQPIRFPPVLVYNQNDYDEYTAKGYNPGSRPANFQPIIRPDPTYTPRQNIRARDKNEDFIPPPPVSDYPRWVNGMVAHDAAEEAAILAAPPEPAPPDSAERAEPLAELAAVRQQLADLQVKFDALMAERAAHPAVKPLTTLNDTQQPLSAADRRRQRRDLMMTPEKREWLALARQAGVRVHHFWGIEKIKAAVEEATKPVHEESHE
jgi:hypothetical protein